MQNGIFKKNVGKRKRLMENHIIVHVNQGMETISRHIYGHFSEHLPQDIHFLESIYLAFFLILT